MPEEEKVIHEGSDGPAAQEWGRSSPGKLPGERTTPVPQVPKVETASLMRVFGGLHRRAQQSLLDMLLPDEQPMVFLPGAAGSGIVGTDSRALVLKAGSRFGAPFHARSKAFEYESVIGVRLDTETTPAVVAVDAPLKIASSRVYWADSRDDPWKARNAIPIEPGSFTVVLERVLELRALVTQFRDRHPAVTHREPVRETPDVLGVVAPLPLPAGRCPDCRSELRPGWKFCPGCGAASESADTGA
jgi:hypothetical protein